MSPHLAWTAPPHCTSSRFCLKWRSTATALLCSQFTSPATAFLRPSPNSWCWLEAMWFTTVTSLGWWATSVASNRACLHMSETTPSTLNLPFILCTDTTTLIHHRPFNPYHLINTDFTFIQSRQATPLIQCLPNILKVTIIYVYICMGLAKSTTEFVKSTTETHHTVTWLLIDSSSHTWRGARYHLCVSINKLGLQVIAQSTPYILTVFVLTNVWSIQQSLLSQPRSLWKQPQRWSYGHMICQNSIFYCTHEEEQGINSTSSFFTFQLTTRIAQILTSHVTAWLVSMIVLTNSTNVWLIQQSRVFIYIWLICYVFWTNIGPISVCVGQIIIPQHSRQDSALTHI